MASFCCASSFTTRSVVPHWERRATLVRIEAGTASRRDLPRQGQQRLAGGREAHRRLVANGVCIPAGMPAGDVIRVTSCFAADLLRWHPCRDAMRIHHLTGVIAALKPRLVAVKPS